MRGRLIVLDGLDGSGKATQLKRLVERLQKEGHSTATFDFPQYDRPFGAMVGRYLRGEFGELNSLPTEVPTILYALDRYAVKDDIQKELEAGKVVVLNRYTPSNLGFQSAKLPAGKERDRFISWISELESRLPQPDLVIFLDVPRTFTRFLMGNKSLRDYLQGEKEDIHEKNDPYQQEVEKVYRKLASTRKSWRKINCIKDEQLLGIEEIHNLIWQAASQIL
jgi:dTMP kinase